MQNLQRTLAFRDHGSRLQSHVVCLCCRQVQQALEKAQAEAMEKAAASSSGGSTQLTVGKAMEASKEAAAQLAANGISHQPESDPADGPSR